MSAAQISPMMICGGADATSRDVGVPTRVSELSDFVSSSPNRPPRPTRLPPIVRGGGKSLGANLDDLVYDIY